MLLWSKPKGSLKIIANQTGERSYSKKPPHGVPPHETSFKNKKNFTQNTVCWPKSKRPNNIETEKFPKEGTVNT